MALSQLQCLDDNHVNPRTHESKPEFLYCEDQRLALEALLQDGREAFFKYLEARGLRGFLSDPELETLVGAVEPYDPDSEIFPENAEEDEPPLSLHYWPELSDTSIPQMDLGWPDSDSYRGVTRTTIYSQPPLDGQAHIKEIVRKMIAQAQKVIAVVMDVFTDVDIFRDLLDAGFKRRVSVYILLERATQPHFLSMCRRANMHAGHLKHLRVRCTDGLEFYTHSSTKVKGRMGHRFMFIDGDKAVSGSYSFTWMSSRLDRNLITVVTGQAVDAFDQLFRILYVSSSSVDLRKVATEPEPEPEPLPQLAAMPAPSAAIARKLYNPKYALVLGSPSNSPTPSADNNSPKKTQSPENSRNPEVPETKKRRQRRASKEAIQEAPPIHPGLTNLEKACLMSYLPTWPEPDPPSDVIGFINIRDSSKPMQVHLQRSEMFGTSQAIRFSSPLSKPEETLPEVAKPRQLTAKYEDINKLQPAQESVVRTQLSARVAEIKPDSLPGSDTREGAETSYNVQSAVAYRTHDNSHMSPSSTSAMCSQSGTSTSLSENNHVSITTSMKTGDCDPLSSISSPLTSSSTALNPSLPSSSSLTSTPPIPKPRTIQLVIKDSVASDDKKLPQFSVVGRPETDTGPLMVHSEPTVVQTSAEKEPGTVPELQSNSGSETGAQTDADNRGNIGEAPQEKQSGTSQESKNEEAVGLHDDRAGMQLLTGTNRETQSHVLISGAPKADSMNIQEIIPKDVEPKTWTSTHCKLTPQIDRAATVQTAERAPTGCEFAEVPNENSNNVTQFKAYHASAHEPRKISYDALTPQDVSDTADSLKAPPYTPVSATYNPHMCRDSAGDSTHTSAADTHDQLGNPNFTPANNTDISDKHKTHSTFQEQARKAQGSTHTPENSLCSRLSDGHVPDLRSPTPEKQSRLVIALIRTTSPDGFRPRTPTPDSRTHTPDPRSYTPDFRTPTPDVSDGYVSPRADSALSTTSEEFYECSDSPHQEPVFDRGAYHNRGSTEDHVSFTHTNTPNAKTIAASPAYINYKPHAVTFDTTDSNTSNSETQSLSGPASISSSSSLPERTVKREEEEETTKKENVREVGKKRRTEGDSQRTQRSSSEEAKRTAYHIKQGKDLTERAEKNKEAQHQAPKRKRVLNQSTAESLGDRGVTPGGLTNEGAETKRLSTGDLRPKKASYEGERPDKEKAADRAALGPSSAERKGRPQSTGETEGQKPFHTPPRLRREQQQESGVSSPSRPSRSPRSLSASRPSGSRQLNHADSKALHGTVQTLDTTSSPRRPSRTSPPMSAGAGGSAAGRKQAEGSHGQQSPPSRQPLAAQGRVRGGQSPNRPPYPKPQTSSSAVQQLHPHSQNQTVSPQEALRQEEGKAPFSISFSRLYSLKGLNDKMNKLPALSKRGSTSSPVQGRKSTS
ncbi:uncharacterized protein LOC143333559 [Chaetodon auriga]|uniref:uncharacterized protein LOC143333559 n=1 Tax=Chaetodon auriga TaxID=39042 RepID=UPI004032898D